MKQLVIVHFSPIEEYPPVLNLLQVIASTRKDVSVTIITSFKANQHYTFDVRNEQIKILRIADVSLGRSKWKRYLAYFSFFKKTARLLTKLKPENILYFDPISSVGPFWYYRKNHNSAARLFIHHHEYVSSKEISASTGLMKWVYETEQKLFKKAFWISQTNEERMNFFLKDQGLEKDSRFHIMPNWPLEKWNAGIATDRPIGTPLKVVYVGALGIDTMYVKEFAKWVIDQNGKVHWDVYSQQQAIDTIAYFNELNSPYIQFKGHCKYEELPQTLQRYHVGVILYKGHIPNYIYNAPNKLFEYHVCGLDCWFPQQMISAMKQCKTDSYPKIVGIDFDNLQQLGDFSRITNRDAMPFKLNPFFAENACNELLNNF